MYTHSNVISRIFNGEWCEHSPFFFWLYCLKEK